MTVIEIASLDDPRLEPYRQLKATNLTRWSGSADPLSRRVLRVSMGAALSVPLYRSDEMPADLARLRREFSVTLAAAVLDADAEPLGAAQRPARLAMLFGSEGHGLERDLVELCERRLTIPMQRGTDSLNVAVAAGIFLYATCSSTRS